MGGAGSVWRQAVPRPRPQVLPGGRAAAAAAEPCGRGAGTRLVCSALYVRWRNGIVLVEGSHCLRLTVPHPCSAERGLPAFPLNHQNRKCHFHRPLTQSRLQATAWEVREGNSHRLPSPTHPTDSQGRGDLLRLVTALCLGHRDVTVFILEATPTDPPGQCSCLLASALAHWPFSVQQTCLLKTGT